MSILQCMPIYKSFGLKYAAVFREKGGRFGLLEVQSAKEDSA